jgi:hypothetical protein
LRGDRKKKTKILDEYCRNTNQERKYAIKKFRFKIRLKKTMKKRKKYYDGPVKAALAEIWKIFDFPCGMRLHPLLNTETERWFVLMKY